MLERSRLREKWKEALSSVLPIIGIVVALTAVFVPMSSGILLIFLSGGAMLIVGMMFFTLGAELALSPMGEYVGTYITRSKKLVIIIGLSFLLGFIVTISEPDLQVLAHLVPTIPNLTLILFVAVGVGLFLVLALLRMLFGIPLPNLLYILYFLTFALAIFVPKNFLAVAFDAGGVTTGPMTVPFIMALGVGVSAIRSDRHAADDSFGLVALCSVGPILSVLILGLIFNAGDAAYEAMAVTNVRDSRELFQLFMTEIPAYMKEIAASMGAIVLFMLIFQILVLKLTPAKLQRIVVGLIYTYIGLVLFLTGANVGFMPAGNYLGQIMAARNVPAMIVPVGMLMGFFIVKAEPAVYVLNKQVEEMTDGNISARAMGAALSIGVAISIGLAMIRVLTGISILYFVLPGYAIALIISFFVPPMYTAIAFDSGGVASGPMTAAFLVPFAQGACLSVGGNIVTDAFGVVAMVAMTPLITIQIMGLYAEHRSNVARRRAAIAAEEYAHLDDDAIISL